MKMTNMLKLTLNRTTKSALILTATALVAAPGCTKDGQSTTAPATPDDTTVSGTTLSGVETGKRETPRVVDGKSKAAGTGVENRSRKTGEPVDGSAKSKRETGY